MKQRFSTLDIAAIVPELKSKICTGWRVNQVYDCDYKTYLLKLNKSIVQMKKDTSSVNVTEETENKMTFIIESGIRMHTTDYDWPRSHAPGSFATKLRKYIRNKRVEDIRQLGIDRVVDVQFGSNQAANHLIVELYDRGNLYLTDQNYAVLAILSWRKAVSFNNQQKKTDLGQGDSEGIIVLKVGDIYSCDNCRKIENSLALELDQIVEVLNNYQILGKPNQKNKKKPKADQKQQSNVQDINIRDLLLPRVIYGSSLLEDKLLKHLSQDSNKQMTKSVISVQSDDKDRLDQSQVKRYSEIILAALKEAHEAFMAVYSRSCNPGYIVQKHLGSSSTVMDLKFPAKKDLEPKLVITNLDFFPILSLAERRLQQDKTLQIQDYESFDKAVDVYFCNLVTQKLDSKAFSAEKDVKKKLENLKIAQEKKLLDLAKVQKEDEERARLIELNSDKVENALLIIRSMIANQLSWADIKTMIAQAQAMNDPIASLITGVKFDRNEFTMKLCDPYEQSDQDTSTSEVDDDDDDEDDDEKQRNKPTNGTKYTNVDIDIGLSAYANARRFFEKRRTAVDKERKTIEVSKKAFKNVERKTKEMLKDVEIQTHITKAKKRYWFENFFWFLSTDGYLVVAGRDAEQNDLLVKRYMKQNDIYVHADLHGAASVIIKSETSDPIPPKTLNEAGNMAVCYSSAWDSKIAINSWWVYPKQVTKTAPAGEYLTTGAFMIRGKKNYMPISNLVLGFGFLFKLEEESIERRREARLARALADAHINPKSVDKRLAKPVEPPAETSNSDSAESEGSSASDEDSANDGKTDGEGEQRTPQPEGTDSPKPQDAPQTEELDEDDDDDFENKQSEHKLVDTLTENPLPEDVILYAIPMCGPYSGLQMFKFKVKIVPGANKRGKAAKTCLGLFLHDKRASQLEKSLLKALKDQDYARNIPNKVKISAPNLKNATKIKPKKSEVRLPVH